MKFAVVQLANPKGTPIVWRGSLQDTFQLTAEGGWALTASEHGVVGHHPSRHLDLFLPWSLVGPCDVLDDADERASLSTLGEVAKRPVGRPRASNG